jgi:hypothetical protein
LLKTGHGRLQITYIGFQAPTDAASSINPSTKLQLAVFGKNKSDINK